MSRVLFIRSNSVNPDPRVEKSAYALGKNGFEVEVLAWDRSCKDLKFENKGQYKINRARIKASYGKPSLIIKLFLWWFYEFTYLIRTDFNIIHACDFDTLFPAVLVSKIKNKTLVYDSFDFYSDSLPKITPTIVRNIIANIEIYFSKFADLIIIADESRKKQFKNKYLEKIIVVNNSPVDYKTNQINMDNKNKEFKLFFAGIINESRGFYQIIKSIKGIHNIMLIVAGYDADNEDLTNKLEKMDEVSFLGKISYNEVIENTLKSDMLFALYDPIIPNHKYSSPNKLFEAMMCGKPIIVSDETIMADIVKKEDCGIVVSYSDIKSIRESIIKLKEDQELREKLGKNGRNAYETKYNWNIMEKRLLKAYHSLNGMD
ncbi:MAG: glycosyltransferase family 4 protein [Methanobacteriaceae archaeon]|nr:glycosyltransferase family 4 protein [Methanobacteriaceae archaeon]